MRIIPLLAGTASLVAAASIGAESLVSPQVAPQATLAPQLLGPAGEGRRAFLKLNCYSCHGTYAAGGMGPNIVHAEQGDLSEAVTEGEDGGMPSYSGYVTATDINNLGAYLRSIGTPSEPTFMDWWKPIPPK